MLSYPSYEDANDITTVCIDARKQAVDYCKPIVKQTVPQLYQLIPLSAELVKKLTDIVNRMSISEDDYVDNSIILQQLYTIYLKP
jgi:hypothetical protein